MLRVLPLLSIILSSSVLNTSVGQKPPKLTPESKFFMGWKEVASHKSSFVINIGQYGRQLKGFEGFGDILYGYEGMQMPVLFTKKGILHLQRKLIKTDEEGSNVEGNKDKEKELRKNTVVIDKTISIEWINSNPGVEVLPFDSSSAYHTYGVLHGKARGFRRLVYHNLYPGIDVEYTFLNNRIGYEYKIIASAGSDISKVKMRYGGDVYQVKKDNKGGMVITSDIDTITVQGPSSIYASDPANKPLTTIFSVNDKNVGFSFPDSFDSSRDVVIDPFVSGTGNLTGDNAAIAKDIDFDYNGNVFVSGGGDWQVTQLAKFGPDGGLLWT
jgi:hypothetical protein